MKYASLAEEKRESDATAWYDISVSTDAEDVDGLPDLKSNWRRADVEMGGTPAL